MKNQKKNQPLTKASLASFIGCDEDDITALVEEGWDLAAIRRGVMHALCTRSDFQNLDLWDKVFLQKGHLWGNDPSETARLAGEKIPNDGTVLDLGFGYGRDTIWMAQRRKHVIGIEKSKIGITSLLNSSDSTDGNIEIIKASMKNHRFAKGSLSGIFSHRVLHLPHPDTALPDIAKNMADAVKVGGTMVVSARSILDYDQDKGRMEKVVIDHDGFPVSAMYKDRDGHQVNYFSPRRFGEVFSPYCIIREFYIGKEPESQGNIKDGKDVYSYYLTAVMEVLPETERKLAFGGNPYDSTTHNNLPMVRRFPSIKDEESINCTPLETANLD